MVMGMYKSPIEIIYGQMQTQMEGDILRAVQSYFPNVDKEELLRALQYDRDQYHKGYADGRRDAMDELVCCENCDWYRPHEDGICVNPKCGKSWYGCPVPPEHFCSYGERRERE